MRAIIIFVTVLISFIFISCRVNSTPGGGGSDLIVSNVAVDINITSPEASELWKPGTQQLITWNISHEISNVKIELYKKDEYRLTIAENAGSESGFQWTIPNNLPASHHYRIKIINKLKPVEYSFSNYFYILD